MEKETPMISVYPIRSINDALGKTVVCTCFNEGLMIQLSTDEVNNFYVAVYGTEEEYNGYDGSLGQEEMQLMPAGSEFFTSYESLVRKCGSNSDWFVALQDYIKLVIKNYPQFLDDVKEHRIFSLPYQIVGAASDLLEVLDDNLDLLHPNLVAARALLKDYINNS